MAKVLMKGNEAMALAAIKAGCEAFYGYPITPQNELPEYMSKHMHENDRVFVQSESEVAAINMVYGAAAAGARVLTSSSSPGIALKQEGISYIAGSELPAVIINVMRGGPGLGGIQPSQGDYKQITRGGGNGDYYLYSLAPESLQEAVDLIKESFDIADYFRNPVMIAVDGLIGQMMEPVDFDHDVPKWTLEPKTWAADGNRSNGREKNIVNSLYLDPLVLEQHNLKLKAKYDEMKRDHQRYEMINMDKAEVVICAFGSTSRIARTSVEILKENGIECGIIRPITIFPFPTKAFEEIPQKVQDILVVEMNTGQMVDDVRLADQFRHNVHFYGRVGGVVPEAEEIVEQVMNIVGGAK
ncbi:3-methyl-2-oxobutanoate dehydrogenase subunit VorB [Candidatus Xianfuyuplasma coldseepsis]|uniref:3-methyl-2-oxobutanoate dehydrogenase subunit VorB n=1 Tax=Candidatus Xianfuyuplasma coldseepsis TaxID=2782163 RepID=A0A7L7KNQ9_9MOLU|nr:3-methyl-2-oxobutanoate dehydrogenase subunit VorB [Xianfuyuplasma coldseepsis]QMS84313.1 3-methyl-2-oxobutanoate dehydrogenase subunit VorB [Xianfuyuplasma coldseepsis]